MNMPIPDVKAHSSAKDQTRFAALWRPAMVQAFVKLDPRQLKRSPVMLVVALTAVLTVLLTRSLAQRRDYHPFFLSLVLFAITYAGLGISMWPYIVPQSVTIWRWNS